MNTDYSIIQHTEKPFSTQSIDTVVEIFNSLSIIVKENKNTLTKWISSLFDKVETLEKKVDDNYKKMDTELNNIVKDLYDELEELKDEIKELKKS